MPAKEIKELRKSGRLAEALEMAFAEFDSDPENIWTKRNLSWVYYEYIKANALPDCYNEFISSLTKLVALELPEDEKMLFDTLTFQVGKLVFALLKQEPIPAQKIKRLADLVRSFHFTKPSEGYSYLLKGFHKGLKDSGHYLDFVDWWGLENLSPQDFEKEKLPTGKEIMALAEQIYIAYAKQLLPQKDLQGNVYFNRKKVEEFLPSLEALAENYPSYQYPPYFQAKLLLALGDDSIDDFSSLLNQYSKDTQKTEIPKFTIIGTLIEIVGVEGTINFQELNFADNNRLLLDLTNGEGQSGKISCSINLSKKLLDKTLDVTQLWDFPVVELKRDNENAEYIVILPQSKRNVLSALIPFARKKQNDFWVWEVLAEAVEQNPEQVFSCHCRALICNSPEEMLVGVRQKMAEALIHRKLYNEAKTEIEQILKIKESFGHKIPGIINQWINQPWYAEANSLESNKSFFRKHTALAENILYSDLTEELVFVEFVNSDKSILNFIASEEKFGFFKFDRFIKKVQLGDVLSIRFNGGAKGGRYNVLTCKKVTDDSFKFEFQKEVQGTVKIPTSASFGFLGDAFIHPSLVIKYKLSDGLEFKGQTIKTYDSKKEKWGWKVI